MSRWIQPLRLHAMLLMMEAPNDYAGVVALSPGGPMAQRLFRPELPKASDSPICYLIHGDQEPHGALVPIFSAACKKAGWRFESATHPGGHHFPENWGRMQKDVAAVLKKRTP